MRIKKILHETSDVKQIMYCKSGSISLKHGYSLSLSLFLSLEVANEDYLSKINPVR